MVTRAGQDQVLPFWAQPGAHCRAVGRWTAYREPRLPQVVVLATRPALLKTEATRASPYTPVQQLTLGFGDIG